MNNKQLYQKNVFLQKSKDKFNPDVLKKKQRLIKLDKLMFLKNQIQLIIQ